MRRGVALATMVLVACQSALAAGDGTGTARPAAARPGTLYDQLPPEVKKNGFIRVVGDSHPPYRILSDDRQMKDGIEVDLARALEPVLGVPLKHHVVNSLSATLAGLESGRYDLAMGPALPNKERLQRFDAVTWLVSYPSFVVPLQRPRRIAQVLDLCGLKVAYVAGSISERVTDRVGDRCEKVAKARPQHVPLVDTNMTLVATQAGRADVAAMTSSAALHVVHETPEIFTSFRDPTNALGTDVLGLFVTRRSGLAPVMQRALSALFDNGEYARIMARWGVDKVAVQAPQLKTLGP